MCLFFCKFCYKFLQVKYWSLGMFNCYKLWVAIFMWVGKLICIKLYPSKLNTPIRGLSLRQPPSWPNDSTVLAQTSFSKATTFVHISPLLSFFPLLLLLFPFFPFVPSFLRGNSISKSEMFLFQMYSWCYMMHLCIQIMLHGLNKHAVIAGRIQLVCISNKTRNQRKERRLGVDYIRGREVMWRRKGRVNG